MCDANNGVIYNYGEKGAGAEARVFLQFRTGFPGIGGCIETTEGAKVAFRKNHNTVHGEGDGDFLRHTLCKKLDDYFGRMKKYRVSHVARPFGSVSSLCGDGTEASIYEWVTGSEGFPWEERDEEFRRVNVQLVEWGPFVGNFCGAGISIGSDISDCEDTNISKNIIHAELGSYNENGLSPFWKRIDFGPRSVPISYETLFKYLRENRTDLVNVLRLERYQMMELIANYISKGAKSMKSKDLARLEFLVADYRRSTLRHMTSSGMNGNDVLYKTGCPEIEGVEMVVS